MSVTNPGSQKSKAGTPVKLQIKAIATLSLALAYRATGLPAGLSINSSTGLISGTPSTAGTWSATVTVRDKPGASGSVMFTWTVP